MRKISVFIIGLLVLTGCSINGENLSELYTDTVDTKRPSVETLQSSIRSSKLTTEDKEYLYYVIPAIRQYKKRLEVVYSINEKLEKTKDVYTAKQSYLRLSKEIERVISEFELLPVTNKFEPFNKQYIEHLHYHHDYLLSRGFQKESFSKEELNSMHKNIVSVSEAHNKLLNMLYTSFNNNTNYLVDTTLE